jgi:hypothetical protein
MYILARGVCSAWSSVQENPKFFTYGTAGKKLFLIDD